MVSSDPGHRVVWTPLRRFSLPLSDRISHYAPLYSVLALVSLSLLGWPPIHRDLLSLPPQSWDYRHVGSYLPFNWVLKILTPVSQRPLLVTSEQSSPSCSGARLRGEQGAQLRNVQFEEGSYREHTGC